VSVRALAASVMKSRELSRRFPGGCVALDYFGDADLLALGATGPLRALALGRDLGLPRSLSALGRAALELPDGATVYAGGLENRPGLLRRLARRGPLLGNGATEVAALRDPARLFPFLAAHGIPHAATRADLRVAPRGRHLWKPIRSGGGGGIRFAAPGEGRPKGHYLQAFTDGPAGSAIVLATSSDAALLGVSRQIAGWRALGGRGFRYGGSLLGPPGDFLDPAGLAMLRRASSIIARGFGLRGLCGIDFILERGLPKIIEVNPRYTASMELCEERSGRNLFDLHLAACEGGTLPEGPLRAAPGAPRVLAKGILYAERPIVAPDPERLAGLGARDRPARGERVEAGQPVCSIVVGGVSPEACRKLLIERAAAIRRLLHRPQHRAPTAFRESQRSW